MKISLSNGMVLTLTPPTKPKLDTKTIFCGCGARNCGLLYHPISTQWTSVLGPCWELRPVESLKVSLVKVWANIPQKKLCAAVESFRGRIELVIAAKG